jgi:hypothetical protein
MTEPNYDYYYAKHFARYHGWLPASLECKKLFGRKPIKYFTLCAREAIDVFMLESVGVLERNRTGHLPNVIICECKEKAALDILKLVRPPLKEAMLVGEIEKILLYQDTPETRRLSPDEDYRDARLRRIMMYKRLFQRITQLFPFDIINFDPYGNFLDPDLNENRLCQSFEKILEFQKATDKFLLFITTPIDRIHPAFMKRLEENVKLNIARYSTVRDALQESIGAKVYNEIDEKKAKSLGFAKAVIIATARNNGWECKHQGIYVYESPKGRIMMSSIVWFYKAPSEPDGIAYLQDVIRIVQQMPKYCSHEQSLFLSIEKGTIC